MGTLHLIVVVVFLNLSPAYIAMFRGHRSTGAILAAIFVLDIVLVLGWIFGDLFISGIAGVLVMPAWLGLLVWSFSGSTEARDRERARLQAEAMVQAMIKAGVAKREEVA